MIIKMCPKCKKPIKYTQRYCSVCYEIYKEEEETNEKIRNRKYNQTRDKKYIRFYKSPDWNLLKNKKLQDSRYRCERCSKLGTEVHHIKPIQTEEGWEQRLDYNNLKTVCVDCHNYYHGRFQKRK